LGLAAFIWILLKPIVAIPELIVYALGVDKIMDALFEIEKRVKNKAKTEDQPYSAYHALCPKDMEPRPGGSACRATVPLQPTQADHFSPPRSGA
jgi:hypothetical protein